MATDSLAVPFREAADRWFQSHRLYITEATAKSYQCGLKNLIAFFGDKPIGEITRFDVPAYQTWRKAHLHVGHVSDEFPGHHRINREIGTLRQILNEYDLWEPFRRHFKKMLLPEDKVGPGQALTPAETERLIALAKTKPRWRAAMASCIITLNTTAGPGEIRNLRLRDIDLEARTITIRKGIKNKFRSRTLPLNTAAFDAVSFLYERAKEKGACLPDHCLLPHRGKAGEPSKLDRPVTTMRKGWEGLRDAFAKEFPQRAGLRMYDLRHTSITHLLSNPNIPPQVVIELAGHANGQMLRRYSHQAEENKRLAVDLLHQGRTLSTEQAASRPKPLASTGVVNGTLAVFLKGGRLC